MPKLLLLSLLCVFPILATAQSSTDIYLVDLNNGNILDTPEGPLNLTNRDGYDNQPFFSPDGDYLLYTSQRGEQSDIYRVSFPDLQIDQVTDTPESEYSPTVTPDRAGFSAIRVESDGTQRLWRFDMDGNNPTLLFEDIKPVGYHAWANDNQVAMFILGEPPTLQVGSLADGKAYIAEGSIGRSMHQVPGTDTISFFLNQSESQWQIRSLDPSSGTVQYIASTLPGREDYAWMPNGTLLMADGPVLYQFKPRPSLGLVSGDGQAEWAPLYDFSSHGISNITRLSVSPKGDKLAFVADRE